MVIALPALWVSLNVVSQQGFTEAAGRAAEQPQVQEFFAEEIANAVASSSQIPVPKSVVAPFADSYTKSPAFVSDFVLVAQQQHDWLFTPPQPGTSRHQMELDITPMVNNVVDQASPVPLPDGDRVVVTVDQQQLTAGSLEQPGEQITLAGWISLAVAVLAALGALVAARNRFVVVAGLGVGAVVAGVVGWALSTMFVNQAASSVVGSERSTRDTVQAVTADILGGLTTWSIIVGIAGAVAVVLGALGAVLFGRRRSTTAPPPDHQDPGYGAQGYHPGGYAQPSGYAQPGGYAPQPGYRQGPPPGRPTGGPGDPTVVMRPDDPTVRHRYS